MVIRLANCRLIVPLVYAKFLISAQLNRLYLVADSIWSICLFVDCVIEV